MTKIKHKTKWDLSLMYKNESDINKHIKEIEKAYKRFAKKYSGKDFAKTNKSLLEALRDYESLLEGAVFKPVSYFDLKYSLDTGNQEVQAKLNQVEEKIRKMYNEIIFFELEIARIPKDRQKKILRNKKFSNFSYFLERVFREGKYNLSEPEEKILNLKSQPSRALWIQGVKKAQNKLEVNRKGKSVPISEAIESLSGEMPIVERRKLWRNVRTELKKVSDFSESEINALVIDRKINDELRGYRKPYSATILSYENTEKEVEALVSEVTKSFNLTAEFYALKAKALKLKDFEYIDRLAPLGKIKTEFDYRFSADLLADALGEVGSEYREIFEKMSVSGQIDAYPAKGKGGGAFCSAAQKQPTFLFLNHTNNFSSMTTLAHEVGHAIHYERSKGQPLLYQQFPISTAEVASTFFENVVFWKVFERLSEKEKVAALGEKIDGHIATIQRQIAFFNFETELHNTIRKRGVLSHTQIAQMLRGHLKSYCGENTKVSDDDGYSFIYVGHFRMMFYVYAYAYGELISSALYRRYQEDPSYIREIDKFLSAGGSKSPHDIFKDIGIDTKKPSFWKEGLSKLSDEIKKFKKLSGK